MAEYNKNMHESIIQPYRGKFSAILLFGPPGSGKGTLGKFLSGAGTQYHLSSGDIFRNLPAHSPAGKLYRTYASKGLLVPDEETLEIWRHYVDGLIATNSYFPESQHLLLDGLPRTVVQAKMLEEHIEVRHIIVLEVSSEAELLVRMQRRAYFERRNDDIDPRIVQTRLALYREQIHDLIAYYPKHLVSVVNGDQKPLEVLKDILVRLSHLLSRPPVK